MKKRLEQLKLDDKTGERFKSGPVYFCDNCKEVLKFGKESRFHCMGIKK